jgi:hypothetical protein
MRKRIAMVTVLVMLLVAGLASVAGAQGQEKVDICHRTNSNTNPYTQINVAIPSVDDVAGNSGQQPDHYGEHQGPVWDNTLKDQKIEWGDIIPPIEGFHNGLNWTAEGQAIWNNNCEPKTAPTTTTEQVTTTTEEVTTTTGQETTTTEQVTTTLPTTSTLPFTGAGDYVVPLAALALMLLGLGALTLSSRKRLG